jgi:hypothetical protein
MIFQMTGYYKYTTDLVKTLCKLGAFNRLKEISIIEPITFPIRDLYTFGLSSKSHSLTTSTHYAIIEYVNYSTDPVFYHVLGFLEIFCARELFLVSQLKCILMNDIFVDVVFPFMPTKKILKKIGIFCVSFDMTDYGLYKLTFVKQCDKNDVWWIIRQLQKDVEKYIPNIAILVVAIYRANWFYRSGGGRS